MKQYIAKQRQRASNSKREFDRGQFRSAWYSFFQTILSPIWEVFSVVWGFIKGK